jgi:rhamnose transport system permease protein
VNARSFSLRPLMRWETLLFVLLIVSLIWGAERSPYFWEGSNFKVATSTFMERAIMALPMTLIIISGEIDLSVASILGLTSAVMGKAWMNDWPLWACILLGLAIGASCGLFNGLLVTWVRLPSLVVTLGTLALFRGLAFVVLGADAVSDYPQKFNDFGYNAITGTQVPWSALIFVTLLGIFLVLLHRSRAGRQIYAVGLNQEAARYSAVRVARLKLWLFVLSGTVASIAGILFTARVSSSRADNAIGFELDVIAAVLLGGVSIFGGRGTLVGVALSLAVVATVRNALGITNVGPELQSIIIGGLLIMSVLGPNIVARLTHVGRRSIVGMRGLSPGPSTGD